MKTSTYNVGIYCRLSKDDNNKNDESASISNQKNMLMKHIMEKQWNLVKIYVDEGITYGQKAKSLTASHQKVFNGRFLSCITKLQFPFLKKNVANNDI